MTTRIAQLLFVVLLLSPCPVRAAPLSATDFLPPVQAQTPEAKQAAEQIQQPEAVKQETGLDGKPVTSAATAQDAVNAAIQRIPAEGGCQQIKFPSGFGWVASGMGIYNVMPNPVSTLAAQRLAYQKAYLGAKKNLAEALYGLTTTGREQLAQEMNTVLTDTDALANIAETHTETLAENVRGLLRGYVIYNVNDQQEQTHGSVSVTIVATPKTMGKTSRVDPSSLAADSIADGLNAVLSELSSGLMPPVGGKTISVPQTGELAFVGFGSAIIMRNENPAVRAKLTLNAQKIAAMRARSALCGIILGDTVAATSSLDETTQTMNAQFEEIQQNDPTAKENDAVQMRKLQEQKANFLTKQLSKEQISSMRSGVLPPGVSVKTYINEEKTMVEAVAVYLPSVTDRATSAGQSMRQSQILQSNGTTSGETSQGSMPSRGTSGQVMNDADL